MANSYQIMAEETAIPVDELCQRFADSPGMFIRGVTPEDARRLYDFGVDNIGGITAMEWRSIAA